MFRGFGDGKSGHGRFFATEVTEETQRPQSKTKENLLSGFVFLRDLCVSSVNSVAKIY
jgi:hypothetical protein